MERAGKDASRAPIVVRSGPGDAPIAASVLKLGGPVLKFLPHHSASAEVSARATVKTDADGEHGRDDRQCGRIVRCDAN